MPFDQLFSPLKLGTLTLPNRLVMPAMTTNLADGEGCTTNRLVEYYKVRARGGVGMVTVEHAIVSVEGKRLPKNLGIWHDRHIEGLAGLSRTIRSLGAIAALQIGHGGRESNSEYSGQPPVAPSDLPSLFRATTSKIEKPVQLDIQGIKRLQSDFIEAARRAMKAGFQAVELHGSHGYLISQFLSPYSNRRTDDYGGSIENRARFLLEIVEGIKRECGRDLAVIVRINGNDYVPDGNVESDAAKIAFLSQTAGADAVHVSAGFHVARPYRIIPGMELEEGCHVFLSEAVKAEVGIPVIAVGRITGPELAEQILTQGRADLIAMGRALICDPDLPKKARSGRPGDIRRCISCNQGCTSQVQGLEPPTCIQNPVAGHETELHLTRVQAPQRVLVIGGGPAGLACAGVSAKIGHHVTLVERSKELGGQLRLAHLPPTRQNMKTAIENLVREVHGAGVEVLLGREADLPMVSEMKPHRVVLAVGSCPRTPQIEGLDKTSVFFPAQVLLSPEVAGPCVAVIGGGLVGAEVGDFLSERGHKVTILEMLPELVPTAVHSTKVYITDKLAGRKVQIITGANVTSVSPGEISYSLEGWHFVLKGIDTIVLAAGMMPENKLASELRRSGFPFQSIGDCLVPGDAMSAIRQGYLSALELPLEESGV